MRIDGLSAGQNTTLQGIGNILDKIEIGDVIKAKILEITSGEVLLKMFDGTEFKAATAAQIDAGPGDTLQLMVNGKNDGRLFMEIVKKADGSGQDQDIDAGLRLQLEKLEIIPDDTNMEAAAQLKSSGIPVSKDIIDKAVSLMQKFTQLSPDNAVFMASKGITPSEKSTSMLTSLLDGKLKLGNALNELQSQLASVIDEFENISGSSADRKNVLLVSTEGNTLKSTGSNGLKDSAGVETSAASGSREISDKPSGVSDKTANQLDSGVDSEKINNEKLPANKNSNEIAGSRQSDNTLQQDNKNVTSHLQAGDNSAEDLINNVMKELFKTGTANDKINNLKEKNITGQLSAVKSDMEASPENIKESVKAAVKILKDAGDLFVKVESDSFKSDIEVRKLFGGILDKLDGLRDILQNTAIPNRDELLNKLDTVQDNMKLLNYVGSNTLYAQIPLNISGFNTTAELFVMKREARKTKIDPGNAVLFLSLDTHNIGTVQSIVEIKGKNVGVNLRAEMPQIIDFMKENMMALYNSLSRNGYKLVDVRYRLISEPVGLAGMEKVINEEFEERRKGIDLRI